MTNFEIAVKIISEDFKKAVEFCEFENLKEMIESNWWTTKEFKEECYQILKAAYNDGTITNWFWNDNCDIENANGELISFSKLSRAVRKLV